MVHRSIKIGQGQQVYGVQVASGFAQSLPYPFFETGVGKGHNVSRQRVLVSDRDCDAAVPQALYILAGRGPSAQVEPIAVQIDCVPLAQTTVSHQRAYLADQVVRQIEIPQVGTILHPRQVPDLAIGRIQIRQAHQI